MRPSPTRSAETSEGSTAALWAWRVGVAQDLFDEMVSAIVWPHLKARGFKRMKGNFHRPIGANWQVVNLQRSYYSESEHVSFTVNFGVVWERVRESVRWSRWKAERAPLSRAESRRAPCDPTSRSHRLEAARRADGATRGSRDTRGRVEPATPRGQIHLVRALTVCRQSPYVVMAASYGDLIVPEFEP